MKFRFLILLLFLTTVSFAQGSIDLAIEPLIEELEQHIEDKHIPGMMVSIVNSQGVIYSNGIGYADIEKQIKVTDKHLFRLGSISKSFTALGLLKLTKQKGLPLSTPINDIDDTIPYINPWDQDTEITIEHVLEHTTGFDDFHLHAIYNTTDITDVTTKNMVKSHKNSLVSRWEPGTFKAYSNSGYVVAGHLLETIAEEPFQSYMKADILDPLKMFQSGFYFKQPNQLLMAQGYQYNGKGFNPVEFTSIQGSPAGGLCTNAVEMSYYLQYMLNRTNSAGQKLGLETQDFNRIEHPETTLAAKLGLTNGYGLGNYSVWKNGFIFHGHDGGIDGFSSRYMYSREADIGVAVSINRQGNATEIVNKVLNYYLGSRNSENSTRDEITIPNDLKQKYSGFYTFMNPRNSLFGFTDKMLGGVLLDFKSNYIIVKNLFGKSRYKLTYAGNKQFYRDDEGMKSALFLENVDNEPAVSINENYAEKDSRAYRLIIAIAVMIAMILVVVFAIYGFVWFLIRLFSKNKKPVINHLILWFGCLSFCLLFGSFAIAMEDLLLAGQQNFITSMIFLSSINMLLFSSLTVFRWSELTQSKKFKTYYIATSISLLIVTIFLYDAGFIGLRLWSY